MESTGQELIKGVEISFEIMTFSLLDMDADAVELLMAAFRGAAGLN